MNRIFDRRFLSPEAVAEILDISLDDVHRLLDSGELLGLRVGQRGPWRVDSECLQTFIADAYERTRREHIWNQADMGNITDLADGRLL